MHALITVKGKVLCPCTCRSDMHVYNDACTLRMHRICRVGPATCMVMTSNGKAVCVLEGVVYTATTSTRQCGLQVGVRCSGQATSTTGMG